LASIIQHTLAEDPISGHVFAFRGRKGERIKFLWLGATACASFPNAWSKRHFVWPGAQSGVLHLTPAQLYMLLEGIDWRRPVRTSRPSQA
jgi:transposase